jgi:hypothetical protein
MIVPLKSGENAGGAWVSEELAEDGDICYRGRDAPRG